MSLKTISECQLFLNVASKFSEGETKLSYAIRKVSKSIEKGFKKYNDSLEDARIDFCSTDEKGNVLKDEKGGYVFSKENLKLLTKKNRELLETPFEVESYIATDLSGIEITEVEKELLTDFVIL